MSDRPGPVLIEVTLPAPADEVWRALRDPATIRRWFGWDYDGIDDEIRQIFVDGPVASDADRTLTWPGGDRFAVEPRGTGSVLRVTRAAPAGGAGWDAVYDDVAEGWITFVQQLRFLMTRHPGDERRTVFLSGRPAEAGSPLALATLGLGAVADRPAGDRYDVTLATGERLAGEVWFRSPFQLGLTVDGYGDGLVVVAERPFAPEGAMLVVTTYGLGADAVAAVDDRWRRWWAPRYPDGDAAGGG